MKEILYAFFLSSFCSSTGSAGRLAGIFINTKISNDVLEGRVHSTDSPIFFLHYHLAYHELLPHVTIVQIENIKRWGVERTEHPEMLLALLTSFLQIISHRHNLTYIVSLLIAVGESHFSHTRLSLEAISRLPPPTEQ